MTSIGKDACHNMSVKSDRAVRQQISISSVIGENSVSRSLETIEGINMSLIPLVSIQFEKKASVEELTTTQANHVSPQGAKVSGSKITAGIDQSSMRIRPLVPSLHQENTPLLQSRPVEADGQILLQQNTVKIKLHHPALKGTLQIEGIGEFVAVMPSTQQVQIWAYEVSNSNLTMSERLVKSNWEIPRLERL